jgi:site-specific recombinase XerD
MTWTEATEAYLKDPNLSDDLSDATRKKYRRAFKTFRDWYVQSYGEEPDPAMLTSEEVRVWRGHLQTVRGLAASTINTRLTALRCLARFHGNTLKVKGAKRVLEPVDVLTPRERGRMLKVLQGDRTMDYRNVAMFSIMVRAGLRVSEVVDLNVDDVEIRPRSGTVLVRFGKNRKERRVPLSKEARDALSAHLEKRAKRWPDTTVLFPTKTGGRLNARTVERMVANAARKALIHRPITPHTLRHTFATEFLSKKATNDVSVLAALATLQRLLGHDNIATTSRYLHPTRVQMQEMVEDM